MPKDKEQHYVKVIFDERDAGQMWGPFDKQTADAVSAAVAGRDNVIKIERIEEE